MIAVVAGILLRDGKILLAQRKEAAAFALKWEFPGGKIEPGESPEEALERELQEELGIHTHTGRIFDAVRLENAQRDLLLLFYFTALSDGEPRALDCQALRWVAPADLLQYDLAPADRRVAESSPLCPAIFSEIAWTARI